MKKIDKKMKLLSFITQHYYEKFTIDSILIAT